MIKKAMENVLIIGAGMTGSFAASLVRSSVHRPLSVSIWDKGRGIGGRMATSRCNKDSRCTVDLGAQYISATPDYQKRHQGYYKEVLDAGVLEPLSTLITGHEDKDKGTKHYIAPNGVSSLVKHFINKADVTVKKETAVRSVSVAGDKVKVTTDRGVSETFDTVVITAPVAQILQLKGDIAALIDKKSIRSELEAVSYSSRFAVGLYYKPGTTIDLPWSAKYITGHPSIRFVSIDNRKRNKDSPDVGPSICVHSGAPWGLQNVDRSREDACADMLKELATVLPELPEPLDVKPHKWRFSQVHKGYKGSPGCVVLSEKPAIILAGDGFTQSNFDGCIDSALAVQQALDSLYKTQGNL